MPHPTTLQPVQPVLIGLDELGGDPWPRLGQEHLDPLVAAGEAVLADQPPVDHAALQRDVGTQPRLDHAHELGDHLGLGAGLRWDRRWDRGCVLGQLLSDGAPIDAALAVDLA